ncbi:urea ABC transporter permease [Halobacteriales archaeon QH_10_67_22]|jgi:branched-chain amino acid transport system permease protein|nr:MAG: urea ABC transporter permease [Halobacteriales archaeon QH_10_67_22]
MATETTADGRAGPVGRIRARLEGPNTVGNSRRFWAAFAVGVLGLVVYPAIGDAGDLSLFLVLALLGLSLSVVWGYAGVLSFGQVVFFGVGGYTFGVVSINHATPSGITAALVLGVVGGALVAALMGYFMFYGGVRNVYVTIITLVSTMVMHTFMAQTAGSEWTIGDAALGGFNGMPAIPLLAVGIDEVFTIQLVRNTVELQAPVVGLVEFDLFYYFIVGVLVLTYLGLRALVNSDYGRVMVAIREDEDRTRMFGYDVKRVKLVVFTVGGALAGLSGVLYASRNIFIDPQVFGLTFATLPVIWVSVGGRKSLLGAVVATIGIEYLRVSIEGEWALVVLGVLLLAFILALPGGIVPWIDGQLDQQRGEAPESRPDAPDAPAEVTDS